MDAAGEWARKIVEVYMTWYTFFVTTNFAVMGYLFTKDAQHYDRRGVRLLAALFIIFNLLGVGSTSMVGIVAAKAAPEDFKCLIHWAAIANTSGLAGNVSLWSYIIYSRRR